jgi:hypothetical protein
MSYAPRTLSYSDGIIQGAESERSRILELLEKYCYGTDSQGTGVIYNYSQLLAEIERDNED